MGEKHVSRELGMSVRAQIVERMEAITPLRSQDVTALSTLSTKLQTSIHKEICLPNLLDQPVFTLINNILGFSMEGLCFKAIDLKIVAYGDTIFDAGVTAKGAYRVNAGALRYIQEPNTSLVDELTTLKVLEGSWLCMAALWTEWIHVGTAEAVTSGEILTIETDKFLKCITNHFTVGHLAIEYDLSYHTCLATLTPPFVEVWPTDVEVPFEYSQVVTYLPREAQVTISNVSLEMLRDLFTRRFGRQVIRQIEEEIQDGRYILILKGSGEVEKVSKTSNLRIMRMDGKILVQLGWVAGSQVVPDCSLPGGKQFKGERCIDVVQRITNQWLTPQLGPIHFDYSRMSVEHSQDSHKIPTTVVRTIFYATLDVQFGSLHAHKVASCESDMAMEFFLMDPDDDPTVVAWLDLNEFNFFNSTVGQSDLARRLSNFELTHAC